MRGNASLVFVAHRPRRRARWVLPCTLLAVSALLGSVFRADALPTPANCQADPGGANDRPGQRDVTRFCVERGDGAPWELLAAIQLDETRVSGSNTIDSCALLNTDADAFANLAVCVTLRGGSGDLTELKLLRLFICEDTKADKCMGSLLVAGPYETACEVTHPDTDPFSPAADDGPGDDYPYDSQVVCAIDLDDFGVSPPEPSLLDTCSYPSSIPNSDSDDCILYSACSTAAECDDANACTADSCDASGVCVYTAQYGAECSDGLFCTGPESCNVLGFCQANESPLNCTDGVSCTIDSCNELGDVCVHDPRNSLCDDGAYCSGVETCDPLAGCLAGTSPNCGDTVACTVDSCDEVADGCSHAPSDIACDDGAWCTGVESCDASAGCSAGTAPNCDDSVACTVDTCQEATDSCSHRPDDRACGDGLFCNGTESCNPLAGCAPGSPADCDDAVGCTIDTCNEEADVCVNAPYNTACDDDLFCNGVEVCDPVAGCQIGTEPCIGPAVCSEEANACLGCTSNADCDNTVYCDGAETCNPQTAACAPAAPVNCDDGVACTLDSCSEASDGCEHAANDTVCDNGFFCDGTETCDPLAGCEAGSTAACDDGIACTTDTCDETADRCSHETDDDACDNGRFCDGVETCSAAIGCDGGEAPPCEADGFDCSIETCDEETGECISDFSRCVCGDREIIFPEECEPPARAGTFEDCNNGIDDDGDGDADCVDIDCEPGSDRGIVCDENCRLDRLCARVANDPATITFNRRAGPDSFWMHGRFPIDTEPDPLAEGIEIEISNGVQPIYAASLGTGDLTGNAADGRRFKFRDKDARRLGAASARGGLGTVSLAFTMVDGQPHLAFRVRAYGDFSAATHRVMSSQVAVGGEVGALTEEWSAAPRRWYLRQRDF